MAIFLERDSLKVTEAVIDPDGDPLSVVAINGAAGQVGTPLALSVGGAVTVAADGTITFDDTGLTWPAPGTSLADSLIATISDGLNPVDVSVTLRIHVPA